MVEQSGETVGERAPTTPGYTPTTPGFSPTSPVADVFEDEPHGEDRVSGDVAAPADAVPAASAGVGEDVAPAVPAASAGVGEDVAAESEAGPASLSSRFHGGDVAAGESSAGPASSSSRLHGVDEPVAAGESSAGPASSSSRFHGAVDEDVAAGPSSSSGHDAPWRSWRSNNTMPPAPADHGSTDPPPADHGSTDGQSRRQQVFNQTGRKRRRAGKDQAYYTKWYWTMRADR